MLQAWYWDYPKGADNAVWADTLTAAAADLGQAGFTQVWLPPLARASFGANSNGYDPKDLYDLGEFGLGRTGVGTRAQVDAAIAALKAGGANVVADVVYNHRDGGDPEVNPAVKAYITTHFTTGKQPFPSDRYSVRLPIGGTSGNGPGDYYFKLSSKTEASEFIGDSVKVYMSTSQTTTFLGKFLEAEPNGGGDCGQGSQAYAIGSDLLLALDNRASGCGTDEIKVTLTAADIAAGGDFLSISLNNVAGGYSDHRFYGVYSTPRTADIVNELEYLTRTDYNNLPSLQGGMNFENFRPNSANTSTTFLDGDFDAPIFFSDYVQDNPNTEQVLFDWTDWLRDNVGIDGLRMDAVKHFPADFVGKLITHLEATNRKPSVAVGEFFDPDVDKLANWIRAVQLAAPGAQTPVRAFDFALRSALKEASDNEFYDVRKVFGSGLVDGGSGLNGFNAVTFLNNHDYRKPGEGIQNNPLLGYVYLLTNNQVGMPCVFWPDYAGTEIPSAPRFKLKPEIDALIAFAKTNIAGSSARTYLNNAGSGFSANYLTGSANADDALIYQLRDVPTGRDVIVAINYGSTTLQVDHQIQTGGDIGENTVFDVKLGTSPFPKAIVQSGRIYMVVPAKSYVVWQEALVSLPVALTAFDASAVGSRNRLMWSVASETDFSHYVVERATPVDPAAFEPVAHVLPQGATTGGPARYEAYDAEPTLLTYYRLRMVDLDGSVTYSDVVSVARATDAQQLTLYPNPTSTGIGSVTVRMSASELAREITVTDATGRRVYSATDVVGDSYELPITPFSAGLYQVTVRAGGNAEVVPLVVE